MDEKYKCIFDRSIDCPVREEYKLQPENLLKFCELCANKPPKPNPMMEVLVPISTMMLQVLRGFSEEKQRLMDYNQSLVSEIVKLSERTRAQ